MPVYFVLVSLLTFLSVEITLSSLQNLDVDLDLIDDGGWETSASNLLAFPGPCDIEVRNAASLSQQEFLSRYAYSKPVVIRGATDNKVFQDQCRKDAILKEYSSKRIRLSSANTHSYEKVDVTLDYYVTHVLKPQTLSKLGNETFYWFGDNNFTEWKSLIDLYKPPPYFLPKMTGAYSFGLAGAGTGVPFHFHGPGFGEVVFGRKRWFMYAPEKTPHFHPNRTTLQWLYEDYPELHSSDRPLECTIGQGEEMENYYIGNAHASFLFTSCTSAIHCYPDDRGYTGSKTTV
ncbi:jmjC domain-containing protein 8-like isoform X2 [Biomphalaria glabrata]|uniref:JmjC domain-containing protein 8-like isoform X2 n=1 Tax=Biomphalaria glabrata TaxID=6526 RepID=A0A9U8EE92_BIOGL|nr:jmjC domain-containing protein 8-like isoform X2 [Biomphalaria glabrata]